MSSIASAVGYNLNSMVNNAEEAAKSIYTSKRIDDFISKEYTSSAEYVSEYQSFFQDTLFENTHWNEQYSIFSCMLTILQ